MKKLFLIAHLYLGLAGSIFLLAISLSGAVIAFEPELNRFAYPQLTTLYPTGAAVNWDNVRAQVEAQSPGWKVIRFYFPDDPMESTYLRLRSEADHRIRHIYVNQYTGQVLGSTEDGSNWIIKIHDLHVNFLSGKLGNTIVTVACYNLAVLSITGIVIWWPRKMFWPRAGRSTVATTRDMHASIGFWSFGFMFLFSVTGLGLHYQTGKLLKLLNPPTRPHAVVRRPTAAGYGHGTSIEGMLQSAREALPGAATPRLLLSERPGEPVFIYQRFPEDKTPAGRSFTTIDPQTGAVLNVGSSRTAPWAETALVQWTREIHTGTILGLPTRLLAVFCSLLLAALTLTGPLVWLGRLRAKAKGRRILRQRNRSLHQANLPELQHVPGSQPLE